MIRELYLHFKLSKFLPHCAPPFHLSTSPFKDFLVIHKHSREKEGRKNSLDRFFLTIHLQILSKTIRSSSWYINIDDWKAHCEQRIRDTDHPNINQSVTEKKLFTNESGVTNSNLIAGRKNVFTNEDFKSGVTKSNLIARAKFLLHILKGQNVMFLPNHFFKNSSF